MLDGLVKWWKKWRRKRKREKAKKKPMEFSKILAVWATAIATGAVIASYTLPIFYRESVSDVTTTVFYRLYWVLDYLCGQKPRRKGQPEQTPA